MSLNNVTFALHYRHDFHYRIPGIEARHITCRKQLFGLVLVSYWHSGVDLNFVCWVLRGWHRSQIKHFYIFTMIPSMLSKGQALHKHTKQHKGRCFGAFSDTRTAFKFKHHGQALFDSGLGGAEGFS